MENIILNKSQLIIKKQVVDTDLTYNEWVCLRNLIACEIPDSEKTLKYAKRLIEKGWINSSYINEGSYFIKDHLLELALNIKCPKLNNI